jgi:HD-like signal output (HDOD) protein
MEKETASRVLKLLESGYSLPPLSVIAMKLVELAADEDSSLEDMVRLVERDPSLTVRVLNLANNAFFSSGRRITTLSQAALRLGSNNLKMTALSVSLRSAFPMGKVGQLDYEQFWRVSLYRGLIAKALAHRTGSCNPEEAFVAGLTMEVGLLIFFDLYVKGRNQEIDLTLEPLEGLLSREKEFCGVDHREVGKAALKYWKFPEAIISCQRYYGEAARGENVPALCRLCEVARLFAKLLLQDSAKFHPFFLEAEHLFGLKLEAVNDIVFETFEEVRSISESLKVEIDKERDLMEVMEKANGALIRISEKVSKYSRGVTRPGEEKSLPSFESIDRHEKAVEDTLQAVAHEIRNPLTVVGGFARRLATSSDPDSQIGKYAKVILDEAARLEKILATLPKDVVQQIRSSGS